MKHRVFVDGQEGTTGLRIHEYLAQRDDVEVLRIDPDLRKDVTERARLLNEADVAFLCLPDAASREAAALIRPDNTNTCLIDASTAHRTAPGWVFGLPELAPSQRVAIRNSKRIANPGCHATAFILLIRPLVDAGLLPIALPLSATSITGYSGGGKSMIQDYEAQPLTLGAASGDRIAASQAVLAAPRPYALTLAHKHLPEMKTHGRLGYEPIFMPIVGPFYKGLAVSVPIHLANLGGRIAAHDLQSALMRRYVEEPFVRVMPLQDAATLADGFFDVQGCNDSNRVDLFVFANKTQALLMARLDNLGKGASGAAVQSMNVHLGLEEDVGL
jgi:N-acetyl-gamma-glutamyl-phosphate reductase